MILKWLKQRKRDKRIEQTTREMQGLCIDCGAALGNNSKVKDRRKCSFCGEPKHLSSTGRFLDMLDDL